MRGEFRVGRDVQASDGGRASGRNAAPPVRWLPRRDAGGGRRESCLTVNFGPAVHGFRRCFHVTLDVHVAADRRRYQLIGHLDHRMNWNKK